MVPHAFACPVCGSADLRWVDADIGCTACSRSYRVRQGIFDFLGQPGHAVAHELEGLAVESGKDIRAGFDEVTILEVEHIDSIAEQMSQSRGVRTRYYQHTAAAYFEAISRAQPDADMRVLELGADRSFFKLRTLRELCSQAYALNIFFHQQANTAPPDWPVRVLGDMNELPFADSYFDLVVCSATLHHTPTLDTALAQIRRVLRPGGRAVVVNEPVEGAAKSWGLRRGVANHDRDEHIHEVPVTRGRWREAIKRSGLRPDYFVPAWFLQQAAQPGDAPADRRFAGLARGLSPVLRSTDVQDLVRIVGQAPGQALLGLPLNVVLWKP